MGTRAVENAVRRFDAAGPGVVAVSGGADSVALVRALHAASPGPLTVAHFHHGLRGADADADAAFVRDLAAHLGLAFRLGGADVAAAGGNLEATARRLRYAWLGEVAAEVGAAWVATGHTADDQAETVLHRLVRGTGLQGLRGIAGGEEPNPPAPFPKREGGAEQTRRAVGTASDSPFPLREGGGGVRFLPRRPLLTVTRADILAYLTALAQPYRDDASNADPRFTRNRIRADLLPLLKTFNPDVVAALGRLAAQAGEAHALVAALARDLLARAELPRAGGDVILDAALLAAAAPLVTRAALRLVWEREGWPMDRAGSDAWGRAAAVVTGEAGGWDFPAGISLRRRGRVVRIGRGS